MSRRTLLVLAVVACAALSCGRDSRASSRRCAPLGLDAFATCGASTGAAPPSPGAAWSTDSRALLTPESLAGGSAEVTLAEGERAAIFVLNAGGRDGATARVEARNVAPPPARSTVQSSVAAASLPLPPGDAGVLELTRSLGPLPGRGAAALGQRSTAAAAPPERTTFCVLSSSDYSTSARRAGILVAQGMHAAVYVDETGLQDLSAAEARALADAFDGRIHPRLTALLGPPSDVDGNGKVILFLTTLPQLWGYYWANDVLYPRDASDGCTGSRANAVDAVYLALPSSVTRLGWTRAEALGELIPGVLAHEYAHLLSFQRRCLARACDGADETWIEEGLAKVAEDEAGYGWNSSRAGGITYLTRTREDVYRGYDGRSLTRWEGDSVGNYEGAHAFFRFHADRLGPDILASLTSGSTGIANVERALGTSFPEALADVATALLFSNTGASPAADHSFTGAGWTPLGERLRLLDAVPLGDGAPAAASLRADGWNAFLTGRAGPGGGAVRIASGEAVKPWVAVVRFTGDL